MKKYLLFITLTALVYSCKKDETPVGPEPVPPPVELTISSDSVVLNPSGYAPLSATISYSYATSGRTKIIVHGKNGDASNVEHLFNDEGTLHTVPVIGLYADYNNTVDVILFNSNNDSIGKATVQIQTGPLPADMPASIVTDVADQSALQPGFMLVSNFRRQPYMLDSYGDVRWVLDFSTNATLKTLSYDDGIARLRNGNFFFGDITTSTIYEVDVLGNVVKSWGLGGYIFHHEVMEKPDGNFIVSVTSATSTHTNGVPTIEDMVIEVNRTSGAVDNVWDLKESLNEYRQALTGDTNDWLHINAVFYDSTDNTIIVSGRTQGVVKLDYDNNVKWILGPHKGWGKNRRGEDLNQFLLAPLHTDGSSITDTAVVNGSKDADDFEWCWYQHSTILIPNGDLMLFDNGTARNFDSSKPGTYSRAVEYKIDEANKTIQQVWEYGKERDLETYSIIVSSVQYLPETNHVVFSPGARVMNEGGFGGKIVEVDYATKNVVYQASINTVTTFGFHRAKKIDPYPEGL